MDYRFGLNAFGTAEPVERLGMERVLDKAYAMGVRTFEPMLVPEEKQGDVPEWAWSLESLQKYAAYCRMIGLELGSAHAALGLKEEIISAEDAAKWIRTWHKVAGIDCFFMNSIFDTEEEARQIGRYLREVNLLLKDSDAWLGYHNHDREFKKVPGTDKLGIELLKEEAGDVFCLEEDIGWSAFAGDEVELAEKFAEDLIILHCKDFYTEAMLGKYEREEIPKKLFSPIGSGVVRTKEIISMLDAGKFPKFNGIIILDQDYSGQDIMDDFSIGLQNVESMLKDHRAGN